MRLRYTGVTPTTFIDLGVSVDPGDTFVVTDDDAPRYVPRSDVVVVVETRKSVSDSPSDTPSKVSQQAVPADEPVTGDQDPGTDTKAE